MSLEEAAADGVQLDVVEIGSVGFGVGGVAVTIAVCCANDAVGEVYAEPVFVDDGKFCGEVGLRCVGGCPELDPDGADDIEVFGQWLGLVYEDVMSVIVRRLVHGYGLRVLMHQGHHGIARIISELVAPTANRFV